MEDYCVYCGEDMTKAKFVMPWEDGDNEEAYMICPHCREKNILYGYGDDD